MPDHSSSEVAVDSGEVSTRLITKGEIDSVLAPLNLGLSDDSEARQGRRVDWVHWSALLVICSASLYVGLTGLGATQAMQDWLTAQGIGENPVLTEARLKASMLASDANQSLTSIVSAYEEILELDSEDAEAQEAIEAIQLAWVSDFEYALTQNQLAFAQSRVGDLLTVDPRNGNYVAMFERLQDRRRALSITSDTAALLRVVGQDASEAKAMAVQAYREVLRLYPASTEASSELSQLAQFFIDSAIREANLGQIDLALDALAQADLADPDHAGLPEAREQVQKATALKATIDARLAEASLSFEEGRLISPEGRNASELYHSVLAADPDNQVALQGLGSVSTHVVSDFNLILEEQQFGAARQVLEQAKNVGLYPASIILMEQRLASSLKVAAEVESLLAQARQQLNLGWITKPQDQSAVYYLKLAKEIQPKNEQTQSLLFECASKLAVVALDAHEANLSEVATEYLELAESTLDDEERWLEMRRQILQTPIDG